MLRIIYLYHQQEINGLNVYHGISLVDQTYMILLNELEKKQQVEQ
jgi:hypothetical protein